MRNFTDSNTKYFQISNISIPSNIFQFSLNFFTDLIIKLLNIFIIYNFNLSI